MLKKPIKTNHEEIAKKLNNFNNNSNHSKIVYDKLLAGISQQNANNIQEQRNFLKNETNNTSDSTKVSYFHKYNKIIYVSISAITLLLAGLGNANQKKLEELNANSLITSSIPANGTIENTIRSINADFLDEINMSEEVINHSQDSISIISNATIELGESINVSE